MSIYFSGLGSDSFQRHTPQLRTTTFRFLQPTQTLEQDTFVSRLRFGLTLPTMLPTNAIRWHNGETGTTGGTIDMEMTNGGTSSLRQFRSKVAQGLTERLIFSTPVDSSNIDRGHQQKLLAWVYQYYHHNPARSLVIKHGTDTMEDSAALLAFQHLPMVIVLTGAYTSDKRYSDGAKNLAKAQWLATVMPFKGVYVLIGDNVHLGAQVKKVRRQPDNSKNRRSYFESITGQPIATFNRQGQLVFNRKVLSHYYNLSAANELEPYFTTSAQRVPKPAYVEHVLFNAFMPKEVFDDLASRLEQENTVNGAVLEGDWKHHPQAPEISGKIQEMAKNGHIIICTHPNNNLKSPALAIATIPPNHLRTKLSILLSNATVETAADVLGKLSANIAGEVMTPKQASKFNLDVPRLVAENHQMVMVTPSLEPKVIEDAVARLLEHRHQDTKPMMLIVGTGDAQLPIGPVVKYFDDVVAAVQSGDFERQAGLKEKLIEESPMLKAIDTAIKQDIDVRIGSKAYWIKPDIKAYEIGYLLQFLGVKATIKKSGYPCTMQGYLDRLKAESRFNLL